MPATKLPTIRVEKPWGRHTLWPGFADPAPDSDPVGEIWFDNGDAPLLVKYLFTSERLSIQVHPNDAQARASGHRSGKDEIWIVLAAEPESTIALGTVRPVSQDELRAAALDGSIETLMHWQPVNAGDVIYSAANTVHAIGAGITLIEVQQNIDLTYRLYDYGRPRELHLDEGIAVSDPVPFAPVFPGRAIAPGRGTLTEGGKFIVERWSAGMAATVTDPRDVLVVPVIGTGSTDGARWQAGECWTLAGGGAVACDAGAELLLAYEGRDLLELAA